MYGDKVRTEINIIRQKLYYPKIAKMRYLRFANKFGN